MPVLNASSKVRFGAATPPKLYLGAAQVWAAYVAQDTFTGAAGTALASHTPELGGPITRHPASTGSTVITAAGRVRSNTISQVDLSFYAPSLADVTVEADLHVFTTGTNESTGICGRMDPTANTYYLGSYIQSTGAWTLSKVVAGTRTVLASVVAAAANGSDHHLKLVLSGGTQAFFVDGVQVGATQNDTAITAAGRVGTRTFTGATPGDAAGHQLDNLVAY